MKCAVHTEADATGYCRNCGKAMCETCIRDVQGVFYCESCLGQLLAHPPTGQPGAAQPGVARPGPGKSSAEVNATIAFLLGLVPGLGAVYNGEYNKALIHIVVFVAMIVGLSSGLGAGPTVALALSLAGFIIYMAMDAYRTAMGKLAGVPPSDPLEAWGKETPVGPLILIGLGVVFLLDRFGVLSISRIFDFWPVILIAVGVLMLRGRMSHSTHQEKHDV